MQRSRQNRPEGSPGEFDHKGHASVFKPAINPKQPISTSSIPVAAFLSSLKRRFDETGNLRNDLFHSLNKIGHALHDLDPVLTASPAHHWKNWHQRLRWKTHASFKACIYLNIKCGSVVCGCTPGRVSSRKPHSCIGFWFALQNASKENGCLWAKPRPSYLREPGSGEKKTGYWKPYFRRGSIRHGWHDTAGSEKGTCIVLHGLLPHYSLPNTSGNQDRPMPATYDRQAGPLPTTELAAQKYDGTIRDSVNNFSPGAGPKPPAA